MTHHKHRSIVKLPKHVAKKIHRQHGTTTQFDSDCLAEAKRLRKGGGTLLTFQDGSQYLTDLTRADVRDLKNSDTGETWNAVYREPSK